MLKHKEAIFPLKSPGLVSIPLSFLVAVVVSLAGRETTSAEAKYEEVHRASGRAVAGGGSGGRIRGLRFAISNLG